MKLIAFCFALQFRTAFLSIFVNFAIFPEMRWNETDSSGMTLVRYKFVNVASHETLVRDTMSVFESNTCIRFEEIISGQTVSQTHLTFQPGTGCISFVGKAQTLSQQFYLANFCTSPSSPRNMLLRLLANAVGAWDEVQRPDRNNSIRILHDNIMSSETSHFLTIPPPLYVLDDSFDYSSATTFSANQFSKNGLKTIETLNPLFQRNLGQRVELSFDDLKAINTHYCSSICSGPSLNCVNSGFRNPNSCDKCFCPDGFTGTLCEALQNESDSKGSQTCGGSVTVSRRTTAEITSPGYVSPGHYENSVYCVWHIVNADLKPLVFLFDEDFHVYCDSESCQHWVELRISSKNTLFENGPRWCCGDIHYNNVTSESDEALVIFKAFSYAPVNSTSLRRGFKLTISSLSMDNDTSEATTTVPTSTADGLPWLEIVMENSTFISVCLDTIYSVTFPDTFEQCYDHANFNSSYVNIFLFQYPHTCRMVHCSNCSEMEFRNVSAWKTVRFFMRSNMFACPQMQNSSLSIEVNSTGTLTTTPLTSDVTSSDVSTSDSSTSDITITASDASTSATSTSDVTSSDVTSSDVTSSDVTSSIPPNPQTSTKAPEDLCQHVPKKIRLRMLFPHHTKSSGRKDGYLKIGQPPPVKNKCLPPKKTQVFLLVFPPFYIS